MNKYLNPLNYLQQTSLIAKSRVMPLIESLYSGDQTKQLLHPPIFFLGAPRSGSTLAIQVITDVLDVGYISNKHCQWYNSPVLAERLFHPIANRLPSDFTSQHGDTKGDYAPAECGEWWYRFFRRNPAYVTLDDVDPRKMRQFRRSVAALTNAINRPIVFKNLYASLRIQAIAHYLPESLFIVIHRNEIENGHSILEARFRQYQNYTQWFSVPPPEVNKLITLPAHQQVIEQIRNTYKTINLDLRLSGVSSNRRFDFFYEEFCENPSAIIEKLDFFLKDNDCVVRRKGTAPKKFTTRNAVKIDSALYEQMVAYSNETSAC